MSKPVYRGVEKNHYRRLIRKLIAAKMVNLRPAGEDTMENTIFGAGKAPEVSQRPI